MARITGLTSVRSSFGYGETVVRLETALRANGLRVHSRIDQSGEAAGFGVELRGSTLFLFGNGRNCAELAKAVPSLGIELPYKVHVWLDADGETWLSYNDPRWLARRHGAGVGVTALVTSLAVLMESVARKTVSPP